jgi:hypothetical protein
MLPPALPSFGNNDASLWIILFWCHQSLPVIIVSYGAGLSAEFILQS